MKKPYIPVAGLMILVGLLLPGITRSVKAQSMAEFAPFTPTSLYTWDGTNFQSYEYSKPGLAGGINPMRFRLMAPNGFDRYANDGQKYPIIVFLHGSGEAGPSDPALQDNEEQLYHGGQTHMNAVLSNKFPGFLLYPQIRDAAGPTGPSWGYSSLELVVYILDKLIESYKVDPDRIYIHGLSLGGEGTLRAINTYPQYFAAAHPMSAAGQNFWSSGRMETYIHIPLRQGQGGNDTAPTKEQGNDQVSAIRGIGGSIRYSYYPTGGHGIWGNEYAKADFFSWFLSKRKNMIHVFYEQTSFCPENPISASNPVKLGLTPGFANYEWAMNTTSNIVHSGATANEYLATSAGTYYARFQRASGIWTDWSPAVVLDNNRPSSPTPLISTNGKSVTLPPLDGSADVTLNGTPGKAFYQWQQNATNYSTETNISVNKAGVYTLATKDPAESPLDANNAPKEYRPAPQGCLSAYSTSVTVTTQHGFGSPAAPVNFFAGASSLTTVAIRWDDRSNNETGFELYRSTTQGGGYVLAAILPASSTANPQTYTDTNLQSQTTYYYRMRAINTSGGSAYTPEVSATTGQDNVSPTAPVLSVGTTSRTEINLLWNSATDNTAIYEYDIYQNNVLIGTTSATSFKATGVVALASYTYVVKARDLAGNVSPSSNQVTGAAISMGLYFRYYHHKGLTTTTQIETQGTLQFNGVASTFSIVTAPSRTQNDNIAYIYEGFIKIPTTGKYTFYTQSDDGSQLFINNTLSVNNDGAHGCNKVTGTTITLSAGTYPIKATFFENSGGECLTVSWKGPGISEQPIPADALRDTNTQPSALGSPTNLTVSNPAPTYEQINLKWTDNSNSETGYEISRTKGSASGTYQVVFVTEANATAWTDTGLEPATTYYYKIRAINATGASALTNAASIATAAAPPPPAVPADFNATALSPTQINLIWSDGMDETGYEIQKSSNASTGFFTIASTPADTTTYNDTQVTGHATVYYRIRALGKGGAHSVYSAVISVSTPNRAPVVPDIINQSITQNTTTPQTINITATDPDADPITFTITGLPTGGSYSDNGYGKLTLTFDSVATGSYPITIQASDGTATPVSDSFILNVNSNHNPVIQSIAINGAAATATTAIANQTTEGGRPLTLVVLVNDPDGNLQLPTSLPPLFSNLPPFVTAKTWSGSSTNPRKLTLTFSPGSAVTGVYEDITITFRDNAGGINVQTFSLVVTQLDKGFSVYMNFVYNTPTTNPAYYESAPWNNAGTPGIKTKLKDELGNTVPYVTLNTGTAWNTTANPKLMGDIPVPAGVTPVYTEKIRESFYKYSNTKGNNIIFTNLNKEMVYKVILYGASPETAPRYTKYTITGDGSEFQELNTANNASNVITSAYRKPKADGTLTINVGRGTGNLAYYYINAMILTAVLPSNDPPTAPSNLTSAAPAYNTVSLTWQDNSINEASFEILRATTSTGPYAVVDSVNANETTFTDKHSLNGRTTYYYKVRAKNAFGANESSASIVTTPNGAPIITAPGTIIVRAGETLQKYLSAIDPEGDSLILAVSDLPAFCTLTDNGNGTGTVEFAPQVSNAGSHTFTFKATDSQSASSSLAITFLVVDSEYDEAFYLNFVSTAASNAADPWNNLLPYTSSTSLKNSLGVTSTNLYFTTGTGWSGSSNTAGMNTGNDSGIYPDKVIQSSWSTVNNSAGVTLTLSNLDNNKRYNIALFGSTNDFWFGNTLFIINGVTKTLNTIQNKSKTARFTGIQPVNNVITIIVKKGPNIATGGTKPVLIQREARLGAMVVEAYTEGAIPRRPTNLIAKGLSRSAIRLTWFDNASDETGYEIYQSTSPAGPFTLLTTVGPNVETFDHTGLPQNTAYSYRVRGIKASGASVFSNDARASTFNQVILVNFNSSGPTDLQAPAPWNNTNNPNPVNGVSFNDLIDNTGATTTVDLEILESLGYTNNTGYMPTNPPGIYPNAVSQGFYYWNSSTPGLWRINQLNTAYAYDLVFYANEWDAIAIDGVNCTTDWTVGSRTVSLFNNKNAYETVSLEQVSPEADGTISIKVVNNPVAAAGVWNALEIRSYTSLEAGSSGESGLRTASVNHTSVHPSVAVSESEPLESVMLYPNPVKDNLMVNLPSAVELNTRVTLYVYNTQGVLMHKSSRTTTAEGIDLATTDLTPGYYALVIEVNGKVIQRRFIKE